MRLDPKGRIDRFRRVEVADGIGVQRVDLPAGDGNHGRMNINSTAHSSFPRQPFVDGRGPLTQRHDGFRRSSPHTAPGHDVPYDVLGMVEGYNARMENDPAQAPRIRREYQQHIARMASGLQGPLNRLPQARSEGELHQMVRSIGSGLRARAKAAGKPPVYIHGDQRGGINEGAAFQASLEQAGMAGIRHLLIEEPPNMASIDQAAGGPAVELMRAGNVAGLKQVLKQTGAFPTPLAKALNNCASNVHRARNLGFEVAFLDPSDGRRQSGVQRNKALVSAIEKYGRKGLGVMVATPMLNSADIAGSVLAKGTPVAAAAFLSDGPESALAFRHFAQVGAIHNPAFNVIRLSALQFAGRQAGRLPRPDPRALLGAGPAPQPRGHRGPGALQAPHDPHARHNLPMQGGPRAPKQLGGRPS